MECEGIGPVSVANLAGCSPSLVEAPFFQDGRDIDVLYVANLNNAVQRERGPWLSELARSSKRWKVVIQTGIFGSAYYDMLRRAKIVFNHNRAGGVYRRAFEAAATGALLFQESGNGCLENYFHDREDCVFFTAENFHTLVDHYLQNESERRSLAEAGRKRAEKYTFGDFWEKVLESIDHNWPLLLRRKQDDLVTRCLEAVCGPSPPEPSLLSDLEKGIETDSTSELHNALGLVRGMFRQPEDLPGSALAAAQDFYRAVQLQPQNALAHTNLAVALALAGRRQQAIEQAKRTTLLLSQAEELEVSWLESAHYPPSFDWIRVEWERAAWNYAGDPEKEIDAKRVLLKWRLQLLQAELTGDLVHYYEAFHLAPTLPPSSSALGCALARTGHVQQAISYLTQSLAQNPLDRMAALALHECLGAVGNRDARENLAQERRELAATVPQLIPVEDWFRHGPAKLEALPIQVPGDSPQIQSELASPLITARPKPVIKVSLSMIVKNEEANLPHCLGSVADLVDEIVIVDTGSTDRTKVIASQFGARIYDFPWVDNFAAARNESLRHVEGQWILWLDGDDRVDETNRQKLKDLFRQLSDEMDAYVVKIRSLLDSKRGDAKLLDQVRLFRRHPQILWQYRIHEQILPSVNRLGGDVRWTDIIIDHAGYENMELRRRKLLRNVRLLELEDAENPNDSFTLFNLGWTTLDLGRPEDAISALRRSLELAAPNASIVRKLFVLIIQTYLQLKQPENAIQICQQGRERFPEDGELLFEEAMLLRQRGDLAGAENRLLQLMNIRTGPYFASVDAGLRTHRARHLLGLVYSQQKKPIEAEAQLRAAVREKPDFVPAWLVLGDLYLDQARWPMLERTATELDSIGCPIEATVLRARGHFVRKEYQAARTILEAALDRAPESVGMWVLLSHVLLSEGRDWDSAERALRTILCHHPGNTEAQHNLEVLKRQKMGRHSR